MKALPMHFSRYILFILLGCWLTLTSRPGIANTSALEASGQAALRSRHSLKQSSKQQSSKHNQRQSRSTRRSSRDKDDLPPQVDGRSAGSRSCMVETAAAAANQELRDRLPALMLLAPLNGIAQTQSTQPLLAWYLRDQSSHPFVFRLYEVEGELTANSLNDPQQTWTLVSELTLPEQQKSIDALSHHRATAQAGISTLDLSALPKAPRLRVGGNYVWQIEVICDPKRPSRNLFAQAALKVVAPSKSTLIQSKTAALTELLEQGLWQDALTISLKNSGTSLQASAQIILDSVVIDQGELEALQQVMIHH